MTDFKSLKQTMYCTPMEVRALYNVFERRVQDNDGGMTVEQDITDRKIEVHIQNADAIIYGYLQGPYGASTLNSEVPYFLGPVTPDPNFSTISLNGVVVASTAITEQWLVKFTADNTFSVTGSVSGAQGSGTVTVDFTTTNGDVQIKAADWSLGADAVVNKGCEVIFSTNKAHKIVRMLSAKLACADLISAYHQSMDGKDPEYAQQLRRQALGLLKALIDPNSDVSLNTITANDIGPVAVDWTIDSFGSDITEYGDFLDDHNPMET